MFSHLYPFKIFLFSLITNIQSFHFIRLFTQCIFAEVLMFTGLGNPINSNAYFENVSYLLPTKKFFYKHVPEELHSIALQAFLFLMEMRKLYSHFHFFFFSKSPGNGSYQLMAPIASAPDQQISVAVSFWTQLSVCSETSAP